MGRYPDLLQRYALPPKENMSLAGKFRNQISNLHHINILQWPALKALECALQLASARPVVHLRIWALEGNHSAVQGVKGITRKYGDEIASRPGFGRIRDIYVKDPDQFLFDP